MFDCPSLYHIVSYCSLNLFISHNFHCEDFLYIILIYTIHNFDCNDSRLLSLLSLIAIILIKICQVSSQVKKGELQLSD